MTYLEAIRADLLPFQTTTSMITRKCSKHDIVATDEVSNEIMVAIIEVELLSQMMVLGSISEGGMSLSYDKDAVLALIKSICNQNGLDVSLYCNTPTVTFL